MERFLFWWNHLPLHIDPVFFQIGGIQIRYYGLMYFFSFLVVYLLLLYRVKKDKVAYPKEMVEDYVTWAVIGILLGSRLGYVLFYNLEYFLAHPSEIFLPVRFSGGSAEYIGISGMSYHGGLIGGMIATVLFCRRRKAGVWRFFDFVVSAAPLGYTFGRIGNFLNGELYGRVTALPWGMYFPTAQTFELRHPSQLYEAFFEGIILFIIVWNLRNRKIFDGFLLSLYLIGYGTVRFFIEYVRQPDEQLGFIIGPLTMGQILCSIMVFVGALALIRNVKIPATK